MKAAKINREMILEAALRLILDQGGSVSLTIRDIARKLGCTHPNIYNYYDSMSELRWDCLLWALQDMLESNGSMSQLQGDSDTQFCMFIETLYDYFLARPGFYRLIWFDPMGSGIPERALEKLQAPSLRLRDFCLRLYPQIGNPQDAERTMLLVHRYFHGEMATWISGRITEADSETVKQRIIQNCLWLVKSYLREGETN